MCDHDSLHPDGLELVFASDLHYPDQHRPDVQEKREADQWCADREDATYERLMPGGAE